MPHSHSIDRTGISRRGFVTLSIAGAGVTAAAMSTPEAAYADEPALAPVVADYPNQIKIAHLSDTHFFSRRLYSDCPDFTIAEHSDRKMFRESGDIIKKAMDEIVTYQPDLVILSGDLTKDGELACHQDIHVMLSDAKNRLKAAGKETQFAVINGNHDINNDLNGRDFSSGFAEHTDLVDPLAFKDLYADCGYDDAIAMFDQGGSKGGSLSYVLRPVKGVTLIAVDSCKYSTDQNGLDVDEHVTSGVVGEKLLQWIESQAKQARAAGDIVFVTQHHGVVPHFSMEPTLMGEYLVDNYEECQRRYADAGVSAVFTGHMHANDIASITTEAGNTLFDIETCATVTYPSDIRFATLGWERETANVHATLALESHPLGSVDYTDFDSGSVTRIPNIEEYGHERLLTVDVVKTMIADALVAPMLDQAAANGGVKPLLAQLASGLGIGDGTAAALDGALFGAVFGMLPQGADEAFIVEIPILGSAGIWANPENRRVMVQKMEAKAGVEPYALTFDAGAMAAVQSALVSEPMAAAAGWSYYISAESLAKFLVPVYAGLDSLLVSGGRDQVLMSPIMKFALLLYYDENYVESVFDKEEMSKYLENDYALQSGTYRLLSFNRNTCIERSSIILSQESKTFLIGNGIGSLTQSQLFKTPLADMYYPTFYFFFTFSYILLELGWLGFILFLLFYALIAYRFYRYYQNTKDSIIKYWSSIGLFMACVSYIFMWYNAVPYSAYYFPFILFSLCFVGIKFRKQKLSINKYINKNGSKSICHRPRV